jgi:hypothetical protein
MMDSSSLYHFHSDPLRIQIPELFSFGLYFFYSFTLFWLIKTCTAGPTLTVFNINEKNSWWPIFSHWKPLTKNTCFRPTGEQNKQKETTRYMFKTNTTSLNNCSLTYQCSLHFVVLIVDVKEFTCNDKICRLWWL